ncbi:F-box domain containing protein [Pandoravirus salinus]|uniref:F-box domain containing protein n=1 Tax=Pandoravirus salinus TaxID=1349410 RepID=S4VWQ1_9VIRU|nr:F-box domain [Pandoravirus salinus]AGO85079.1 F-box domain containing protein [Pandoravirus salinus]
MQAPTMDDMPSEIVELVLGQLDHIADRVAAHCVCRLWRERLAQVRRYAWVLNPTSLWTVVVNAIEDGQWSAVSWLLDGRPRLVSHGGRLLLAATRAGSADAVTWLRAHDCRWTPDAGAKAIVEGHLHVVDQLQVDACLCHKDVLCALAQVDDVGSLRSIAHLPPHVARRMVCCAVASGSVSVLAWLYQRDPSWATLDEARCIIVDGHPRAAMWAVKETTMPIDSQWFYTALERGRLDTLLQFHRDRSNDVTGDDNESRLPDAASLLWWALYQGRVDIAESLVVHPIVRFYLDNRRARGRAAVWSGCAAGQYDQDQTIHLLALLLEAGFVRLASVAYYDAASRNHVALLRWFDAHQCPRPLGDRLGAWCLESGHVDVVAWALSADVVLPADAITRAIGAQPKDDHSVDRHAVVTMLTQHGHAWSAGACEDAARQGMASTLALGVARSADGWDPEKCLRLALSVDSPRHRKTAAWIGHRADIDVDTFERNLVRSALLRRQK